MSNARKLLDAFHSPYLDHTSAVSTDDPSAEWRVDADKTCDGVLVRFQQVLLVVIDERQPLRCAVILTSRRRVSPSLDMR